MNATAPILVTLLGIMSGPVNPEQLLNALFPIRLTVEGMVGNGVFAGGRPFMSPIISVLLESLYLN